MDRNLGRLLDWLEERDLRSNTLVVFMSDNGMNMGHHGLYGKGNATWPQNMFDTSVKVPCLISRPGHVPEGRANAGLLSQYDWLPTLMEYLCAADRIPDGLPGRSFAPLLADRSIDERKSIYVFDEYGPVRMIRSAEWKLVWRYPAGPHELYDVAEDPDERVNLSADPDTASVSERCARNSMTGSRAMWIRSWTAANYPLLVGGSGTTPPKRTPSHIGCPGLISWSASTVDA